MPAFLDLNACISQAGDTYFGIDTFSVSFTDGMSGGYGIILAFVWQIIVMFAFLMVSRWLCACAYHGMLHWLLFQSTTDPALASAYDVPFINLCQSWLPWVRIRMVVEDHRELEQYWCTFYITHVLILVVAIVVVCFVKVLRIYFFFDLRALTELGESPPTYPLVVANVLLMPLLVMASTCAKVNTIQNADCVQLQQARWKLFLDNSTIFNAGLEEEKAAIVQKNELSIEALKELELIVERRNADAWPSIFGIRVGPVVVSALYALALLTVSLTAVSIAIEIFEYNSRETIVTAASIRDILRLGFAALLAPSVG